MKRDWKYTVLVITVLTALGLTGCGQQTQQAEQPQLVKAIQVGSETAGTTAGTYSGTVKGRYQSNLSFQAGGRITARNVQLGSQVHAGDVLMTVDPKDVAQAVNQTQAQVDAAAAQLQLAQSNLTRYQQLYDMDAISASVLDQYQTAYDQASAQYNQALAAQQAQENQLSYTQLTADADGVISAVSAEVGQVVAAGQTVVTLVHSGDLEVQVNVPENKLADFPVGQNVTVTFWALQNQQAAGVVREVAPMADAASRTYQVNISLPNPPDGMQLGMTATVANGSEQAAAEDTFVLPLAAIYQTGDMPQVWVVGKDKTLSLKDVTVQDFGDNTVKVTGLSRGDVVVTAGVHMLSEGQKVRVEGEDE
ncbi:efflux RND transporter periplasmic adaptor subunit [Megasphaera sp.]|uniref:efflux RND transporter periplasmic adaptor subunit n=1 Tax=Megasphaera sp. TaxID=2023260 RepID=UPI00307BDC12